MKRGKLLGSTAAQPNGIGPKLQKTIGEMIERGETFFLSSPSLGIGKSAMVESIAAKMGRPFVDVRLEFLDIPSADEETQDLARRAQEEHGPSAEAVGQLGAAMARVMSKHKGKGK